MADDVRFQERGASWYAVLAGPVFALVGYVAEVATGPAHPWLWVGACIVLSAILALVVYARRMHAVVRLTASDLTQGTESLSVARVTAVCDSHTDAPTGARVLGTGMTNAVPRGCQAISLRLDDGSIVVAWARDGEALRSALTTLVSA